MIATRIILVLAVAASAATAGCLRTTTFTCGADVDCAGGVCEPNSLCSFVDTTCPSGRRYGELSGDVSAQCVGGGGDDIDARPGDPDGPPMIDAPSVQCPGSYGSLAGAPNVYRSLPTGMPWTDQQIVCVADGAYLVIPDTASELAAVVTLAGAPIWVGLSDMATEGTFLTVRGGTPAFLPWGGGQPDNDPPGEDCVLAATATPTISDERCNLDHPAVCECEP